VIVAKIVMNAFQITVKVLSAHQSVVDVLMKITIVSHMEQELSLIFVI